MRPASSQAADKTGALKCGMVQGVQEENDWTEKDLTAKLNPMQKKTAAIMTQTLLQLLSATCACVLVLLVYLTPSWGRNP